MRLVTSGCTIRLSPYMAGNDCVYEIFDKNQDKIFTLLGVYKPNINIRIIYTKDLENNPEMVAAASIDAIYTSPEI